MIATRYGRSFVLVTFLFVMAIGRNQAPAQAERVKDINAAPVAADSSPEQLLAVGSVVYFAADDGRHGVELWKSDGTTNGTVLVQDIHPGGSSHPVGLTSVSSTVFFVADDGTHGEELWKTDGTAAGTVLVRDICPGPHSSFIEDLTALAGIVYFRAETPATGTELFKSDGTAAGTVLVRDLQPGSAPSFPDSLTAVGSKLFFSADDGVHGIELWQSDGTELGTILVEDVFSGGSSFPRELTEYKGRLLFSARDDVHGTELWCTDGTAIGTTLVRDIVPGPGSSVPLRLTVVGNTLFFSARDSAFDSGLWRSDGSAVGTVLLKTFAEPFGLLELAGVGETLYVAGRDDSVVGLWKSDGTAAGTRQVKSIEGFFFPFGLIAGNGLLYFAAFDEDGWELWRSDGTLPGTRKVRDLRPGSASSSPGDLTNADGTLFFSADDGVLGRELWTSDSTPQGTVVVRDIHPVIADGSHRSSQPQTLTAVDDSLFFTANDGVHGEELWKSDGTEAGTALVKDIVPGPDSPFSAFSRDLTAAAGRVFFVAADPVLGNELWATDGTAEGTGVFKDLRSGTVLARRNARYYHPERSPASSNPNALTAVGNSLFFQKRAHRGGTELWKTDGTRGGTRELFTFFADSGALTDVNGTLFLSAHDGDHGWELWKSDGTTRGTVLVRDIHPGEFLGSTPIRLTAVGGMLFFTANDGTHGRELWKSDGTAAGTVLVKDISPNFASTPEALTDVNGTLFFFAFTRAHGHELWKSDGTAGGTVLVKDIYPGRSSSLVPFRSTFTAVGNTVFFAADDGIHGRELWKSDGSAAGTVLVKDIVAGSGSAFSVSGASGIRFAGAFYFRAFHPSSGNELWRSDGSDAGTVIVADIVPGPGSSGPGEFVAMNGQLYFSAADGAGHELWKYNPQ